MKRNIGAVVLAGVCLAAGVAIGRMSADAPERSGTQTQLAGQENTAGASRTVASAPPPSVERTAQAMPEPQPSAQPGSEPSPSLALKSDPDLAAPDLAATEERKTSASAPPVKLLNPNVVDPLNVARAKASKEAEEAAEQQVAQPTYKQIEPRTPMSAGPPRGERTPAPPTVSSAPQDEDETGRKRGRWKREVAKRRAAPSREQTARQARPASPNRDYQSLRDYVLTR